MISTRTQSLFCTATPITSFVQCSGFMSSIALVSRRIYSKWNLAHVNTLAVKWILTNTIHHWRICRSNYRKLACVGFEPTTTEIRWNSFCFWISFKLKLSNSYKLIYYAMEKHISWALFWYMLLVFFIGILFPLNNTTRFKLVTVWLTVIKILPHFIYMLIAGLIKSFTEKCFAVSSYQSVAYNVKS